jgi:acyl carrier protein
VSVEELRRAALEAIASVAPDLDEERLAADQPLRAQVDLDSMDWLNIVVALDERLGVAIPEQDYGRVATLDDLVAYLSSHEPRSGPRPTAPAADIPAQPLARVHTIAGETVTVRPIRPDDAPMEADFVRHLSNETRYKRFMATMRELPKDKLRYLTEVDQVKHVALVAILERDGAAIEVGVARYIVASELRVRDRGGRRVAGNGARRGAHARPHRGRAVPGTRHDGGLRPRRQLAHAPVRAPARLPRRARPGGARDAAGRARASLGRRNAPLGARPVLPAK